jgi:hypothetical protein
VVRPATPRAGQHWISVARMVADHFCPSGLNGSTSGAWFSMIGIGSIGASIRAGGDGAAFAAAIDEFCVTLPTIACPPSLTETF